MKSDKVARFTSIGRPLDFSFPGNLIITIFSGTVFVGGTVFALVTGSALGKALLYGLGSAASVFIAWAVTRELDPDYGFTGLVAALFAVGGIYFFGLPNFFLLIWFLLSTRIVNRTAGPTPAVIDSIIILLLSLYLVYSLHWVIGYFTAAFFTADAIFQPKNRRSFIFSCISAAAGTAAVIFKLNGYTHSGIIQLPHLITLGVISVLFALVIFTSGKISSQSDIGSQQLLPLRVQAAQFLGLAFIVVLTWIVHPVALSIASPLWASIAAAGIARPFILIRTAL